MKSTNSSLSRGEKKSLSSSTKFEEEIISYNSQLSKDPGRVSELLSQESRLRHHPHPHPMLIAGISVL